MTRPDDADLHERFEALQRFDAERTPSFQVALHRPRPHERRGVLIGAATGAAAAVALVVMLTLSWSQQDPAQATLTHWPVATAGLTEVFESPATAIGPSLPSDALRRIPAIELKETP